MIKILFCKHKNITTKTIREPRYNTDDALITYSVCCDCKKLLKCNVKLIEAFKYPSVKPQSNTISVIKKDIKIVKNNIDIDKEDDKSISGDTFIKSKKQKRNTGRKPSAPTASSAFTLGAFAKDKFNVSSSDIKENSNLDIDNTLDNTYKNFEIEDDEDDFETIRKETSEESKHRFDRAKRLHRKG